MNTIKKLKFITELNNKINEYVTDKNLFAGGCCYAAYVLAKYLTECGIKYRTVIFQYMDILNETDFNNAITGDGVSHVAIEVTLLGKRFIIGSCDKIYFYFETTGYKYKVRRYKNITPEELLDGYKHNEWNCYYNTCNNGPLMNSIKSIYNKYAL